MNSGYWRTSSTAHILYECPLGSVACVGGTNASKYCEEGYEGPLCALCGEDYFFNSDEETCEECTPNASSISFKLIIFAIIAFALISLAAILKTKAKNYVASFYMSIVSRGKNKAESIGAKMIEKYAAEGYTVKQNSNATTLTKSSTIPLMDKVSKDTNLFMAPVGSIETVISRRTKGNMEEHVKTVIKVGVVDSKMLANIVLKLRKKAKNQLKALTSFFQSKKKYTHITHTRFFIQKRYINF